MKLLWTYVKRHKKMLLLALLLATINQVFSLMDPQIFRIIIDNYASKASEIPHEVFIKGVLLLLGAAIGVALVSRIAKNFQDYCVSVITQRVGTSMYADAVAHTLDLPYSVFEDQRSGEVLQKLQKARQDSQALITSSINTLFLSLVGMTFVIIYAYTVHWAVGSVYVLIIPILGVTGYLISRRIKAVQKRIVTQTAALAGSTTETLRNVELVKSLGLERQEIKRLNAANDKILELELEKVRMVRTLSFIQGTTINAMRAGLLLLMLVLIMQGNITLGEFFTLFVYSFFVFTPLGELGTLTAQYQEARASIEKLDEILSMKPLKKARKGKIVASIKQIQFKNVSFKYDSGQIESLQNIDFTMKSGDTVAFVGPSGSGKSTVIKLLVGLYAPSKGVLLVNDVKRAELDEDTLRSHVGMVAQETQLFAGTIRENLLFVNPSATDKECLEVMRLASISNLLERGGQGLDTRIGEGGIKISGGERQRLAIARSLLRNPELIIFDEATSSLDSITEREITNTIKDVRDSRKNVMLVLIAHRLSTVAHADVIYVLEKGRIVESGKHAELLKKKGLYYSFWREQSAEE